MHSEPPHVIAVVSPHGYRRLEVASSRRSFSLQRGTALEACNAVRNGRRGPVVVDPSALSRHDFDRLLGVIAEAGSSVLFHCPYAAIALDRVLECAQHTTVETVIWGVCNEPGVLRDIVAGVHEPSGQARVLRAIAPRIATLPPRVRRELAAAFSWHRPATVPEVATRVGGSRRTIERQLAAAGLRSTAVILRIAALSKCWHGDADNESAHEKALRCGFQTARTMQRSFRLVLGSTARHALSSMTTAEAARALTAGLCTSVAT